MADPVISVLVEKLADFLIELAKNEINLLLGVEKEVANLLKTLEMIRNVVDDAGQRMITDKSVKSWLHDLEDLSYQIDDVLDEWNYMILKQEIEGKEIEGNNNNGKQLVCSFIPCSCFCFNKLAGRHDIAKKVKELNEKLNLIDRRKDQFSLIPSIGVASNSQEWKRVQSTSYIDISEVHGRASDKDTLIERLLSRNYQEKQNGIQILGIVGAGGIGKTTLVQLAYNDNQVQAYFEKQVWVCVSDPFEEARVAKAILQSLGSNSPNSDELDPLLNQIREVISGKRVLIVFDDVWSEDRRKWEPFKNLFKHCAPGTTVLLTTRNEKVSTVAGASIIPLGVLSDSDSWSLFCQFAFFDRSKVDRESLEDIGREITKKCKGLPLAIKTIGSLLRFKETVEDWKKVKNSNMWELKEAKVDLFPHLYLSYNDLSSQMKRCFSYCAIFPKDEILDVDDLISMWMAQGYLNTRGGEDKMEAEGREVFKDLVMRSFFQNLEKGFGDRIISCKMHDIVHDFAQFVTERECLIIEGSRKLSHCENARHVTWLGSKGEIDHLSNCNIGQPRNFFARSLKLDTLPPDLLTSLKLVRVLKLVSCNLKDMPREIGTLILLRYLDLSRNQISELPATIYDLYNLQTLSLLECDRLFELPEGIEKLIKLKYLSFEKKFPEGIGKLTCLQKLCDFSVGRGFNKLAYLKNLNQLHLLTITIKGSLDDATCIDDWKNANLKSKVYLRKLIFWFENISPGAEDVMEFLEPPPNLQYLMFNNYGGTQLPTWITSLNNLKHLLIESCSRLTSLSSLGILPSLDKLDVVSADSLEVLDLSFLGIGVASDAKRLHNAATPTPSTIGFPRLTELKLEYCRNFKNWEDIGPEDEKDIAVPIMPHLRWLTIYGCRKLESLPCQLLRKASSLECMKVDRKKYDWSKLFSGSESIITKGNVYSQILRIGPKTVTKRKLVAG